MSFFGKNAHERIRKNLIERQAGIYCLGQKSNINDPGLKPVNDILIGTLINLKGDMEIFVIAEVFYLKIVQDDSPMNRFLLFLELHGMAPPLQVSLMEYFL